MSVTVTIPEVDIANFPTDGVTVLSSAALMFLITSMVVSDFAFTSEEDVALPVCVPAPLPAPEPLLSPVLARFVIVLLIVWVLSTVATL